MVDRSKLLCGSASLEPEVTVSPNVPGFIPTGNSVVLSPAAHPSERTLDTLSLVTEEGTVKMEPYQSIPLPFRMSFHPSRQTRLGFSLETHSVQELELVHSSWVPSALLSDVKRETSVSASWDPRRVFRTLETPDSLTCAIIAQA
ncbi:hypothetical protein ALC62_10417 [Cyphomyrmex costatus]|uniref:Uncharacterized protein n=2 Tax=Attini TaxID=143999 RepID=A0A151IDV0_9HYME|nr:hypothetical protein ALC62_10417 [Cyphomyrmex costatus]